MMVAYVDVAVKHHYLATVSKVLGVLIDVAKLYDCFIVRLSIGLNM
jgi:hypothetical protein